jgi:hypothetical protein
VSGVRRADPDAPEADAAAAVVNTRLYRASLGVNRYSLYGFGQGVGMKREVIALTASSCALIGCATRPRELVYADGPGPYDFNCSAPAGYARSLNLHVPNGKLRIAGFIQFEDVAAPDAHWFRQAEIYLQGTTGVPFVSLWGFVSQEAPDKINFALHHVLEPSHENKVLPSQTSPIFAVMGVTDPPLAFELTMNDSRQLRVSVGGAVTTFSVPQFDVLRASLTCSGTHVRYSAVTVSAQ